MNKMNQRVRNLIDSWVTPRMVIDLPEGYALRIYTTTKTEYGFSSVAVLYSRNMDVVQYRTANGQCSQNSKCLEVAFKHIGKIPRHLLSNYKRFLDLSGLFSIHHVGGNYYKVEQWVEIE